jgi:hypothetical protein
MKGSRRVSTHRKGKKATTRKTRKTHKPHKTRKSRKNKKRGRKSRSRYRGMRGGVTPEEQEKLNQLIWKASRDGNKKMVELVLEKNADVNMRIKYGDTPLIIASAFGHVDIVRLLLEKGADITLQNMDGLTAFDMAAIHLLHTGHTDIDSITNTPLYSLLSAKATDTTHLEWLEGSIEQYKTQRPTPGGELDTHMSNAFHKTTIIQAEAAAIAAAEAAAHQHPSSSAHILTEAGDDEI